MKGDRMAAPRPEGERCILVDPALAVGAPAYAANSANNCSRRPLVSRRARLRYGSKVDRSFERKTVTGAFVLYCALRRTNHSRSNLKVADPPPADVVGSYPSDRVGLHGAGRRHRPNWSFRPSSGIVSSPQRTLACAAADVCGSHNSWAPACCRLPHPHRASAARGDDVEQVIRQRQIGVDREALHARPDQRHVVGRRQDARRRVHLEQ